MAYALVYYPDVPLDRIDRLRSKYDPQAGLIGPHITLIFPVAESVGEPELSSHITAVLNRSQPFSICLAGLEKSWDDCLFLVVTEGKAELARLHEDLYTGPLVGELKDMPYVPHVTLGVFKGDPDGYARALAEAVQLNLNYTCVVDRLDLVRLCDRRNLVLSSKSFPL
jgi:2'-5' RNA ligase